METECECRPLSGPNEGQNQNHPIQKALHMLPRMVQCHWPLQDANHCMYSNTSVYTSVCIRSIQLNLRAYVMLWRWWHPVRRDDSSPTCPVSHWLQINYKASYILYPFKIESQAGNQCMAWEGVFHNPARHPGGGGISIRRTWLTTWGPPPTPPPPCLLQA